jgi:hypothetical protein
MIWLPSVAINSVKWLFCVARAISRWNWKSAATESWPASTAAITGEVVHGAALRRQAGRFRLQPDAQLQHRDDVLQRAELLRRDLERGRVAGADDEGADAMARLDEAGGLQLGDGFAHDGAADLELFHDRRLGGQLGAGLQLAGPDAIAEALDQFESQRAGPAADNGLIQGLTRSFEVNAASKVAHVVRQLDDVQRLQL